MKTWRDAAIPIIAAVIKAHCTDDLKGLRKALRCAYPWGPKEHHPYKIWCDEIRRQLGLKSVKDTKGMMITKEQFEAFTPRQRGYVVYMRGAWESEPHVPEEENPYPAGSEDYAEWARGQMQGVLVAQNSEE